MATRRIDKYKPVTIEALQPDGSWYVRKAFYNENAEVQCGSMDRQKLIEHARRMMVQWQVSYDHASSPSLRISNGGK